MIIFESNPGKVVRLLDPAVQCAARTINFAANNPDRIRYELQRSIITRVTLSAQVNAQFLHTLGGEVYIYVFGNRIGQISLSGLAFGCPCDPGALVGFVDDAFVFLGDSGAELMYLWYKDNRASARQGPLRLLIGNTPIDGFVISFTEDVVDAASSLVQWNVTMVLLPEDPRNPEVLPPPTPVPGGGGGGGGGGGVQPPPVPPVGADGTNFNLTMSGGLQALVEYLFALPDVPAEQQVALAAELAQYDNDGRLVGGLVYDIDRFFAAKIAGGDAALESARLINDFAAIRAISARFLLRLRDLTLNRFLAPGTAALLLVQELTSLGFTLDFPNGPQGGAAAVLLQVFTRTANLFNIYPYTQTWL